MKKILLTFFISGMVLSTSFGQSSSTPITVETVTSIKPIDGVVLIYNTQDDYDSALIEKTIEYKELIVKNQNNPEKANFYREELWRLENARIEIK